MRRKATIKTTELTPLKEYPFNFCDNESSCGILFVYTCIFGCIVNLFSFAISHLVNIHEF